MKILIIGGTRFVGKYLVNLFENKKNQLTIISKKKIKIYKKNIRFINLERSKGIKKIKNEKFDLCFDFIAFNKKAPREIFKNVNLKRYILISTTWIPMFLKKKANDVCHYNKKVFDKIDAPKITKNYIKGKILSENEVIKYRNKNFFGIILRLPVIFGLEDHTKRLDFYFSRMKKKKDIYLIDKGNNFIQFCWYEDIAKALKRWSMKPDLEKRIIWEALPKKSIKLKLLIKYLASHFGEKIKLINVYKNKISKFEKDYIKYEPFFREKKINRSVNNIFNFLKFRTMPITKVLKKISKHNKTIYND